MFADTDLGDLRTVAAGHNLDRLVVVAEGSHIPAVMVGVLGADNNQTL